MNSNTHLGKISLSAYFKAVSNNSNDNFISIALLSYVQGALKLKIKTEATIKLFYS